MSVIMPIIEETADVAIKRVYSSGEYKVPLDIDQQHELKGELLSALLELRRREDDIFQYKDALEDLTKLIQELFAELEVKNAENARLSEWWRKIGQARPLGESRE